MPIKYIYNSVLEAVGNTGLIKLNQISKGLNATIYVKYEALNPGGSIKDRVAVAMINHAEKNGQLKQGGTIIEATAGNTGVGLAQVAAARGYKVIFVLPDKMSNDKISLLKAYGAEVVITPTNVSPDSPESYNGVADRLARDIPGAFRPNQFENDNNPLAHYLTTGPEIWRDSNGNVDIFVAGIGTGGTISGAGKYLKEQKPDITVVGADIQGSILSGISDDNKPCSWNVEGIGEDFIPKTFSRQIIDYFVRVTDKNSFNTARRLAREEGILSGGSSGTALWAALEVAKRPESAGKNIVVILPDTGRNYLSKQYSDSWMKEKGFWEGTIRQSISLGEILEQKNRYTSIISISPEDTLEYAVKILQENNISQLPVINNEGTVVGTINEAILLRASQDEVHFSQQPVSAFQSKPLPLLDAATDISEAYRLLLAGAAGILITKNNKVTGLITQFDLIYHRSSLPN